MFFADMPYISDFFKRTVRDNAIPFVELKNILDSDLTEFISPKVSGENQ